MNSRTALLLLVCGPVALACQQMNNSAGSEDPPLDFGSVADPGDNTIPTRTTTPQILRADGTVTTDPCDKVRDDAIAIRQVHCAGCHETTGGAKAVGDPLRFIMQDDQLMATAPSTNTEWTALGLSQYIKPGDPDHSLLYWRAAVKGDMPKPAADPRITSYPPTSLSEDSVLREWITHCMGTAPAN